MYYFSSLKKIALLFFILSNLIYAQSIAFDNLVDGQVRSDYYYGSTDVLSIPTAFHYTSSSNMCCPFFKLFVFNSGGNTIEEHNGDFGDIPSNILVSPGIYELRIELWEYDVKGDCFNTAKRTYFITEKYTLKARNNFNSGNIYLDGSRVISGSSTKKLLGEGMSVSAINQSFGGYTLVWKESGNNPSNWMINYYGSGITTPIQGANTSSYTYYVQNGNNMATVVSDMRKVCNVSIQNNMSGTTGLGTVSVDDVQGNVPFTKSAVEGDQLKLTALASYDNNYIHYTFSKWENGSTGLTRYVNPVAHVTYTASFKGTPLFSDGSVRHLSVTQSLNNPLRLSWSDHPNPLVTCYRIYRKVQNTPSWTTPELLATVPRGTTSFDDPDYIFTNNYNTILLYDVRAVNTYDNLESGAAFQGPYYGELYKNSNSLNTADAATLENSLGSYPNPFNPSTQIRYSIKEKGFVSLSIYDILGNKVAELVNEFQPAGSYSVSFNAADKPSGIYICTIKASNYSDTKKLLLVK